MSTTSFSGKFLLFLCAGLRMERGGKNGASRLILEKASAPFRCARFKKKGWIEPFEFAEIKRARVES